MGRLIGIAMLALAVFAATASATHAEGKRFALIIANVSYSNGLSPLVNPHEDATIMAQALQHAGFQVTVVRDADLATMKQAVIDQAERVREAGDRAVSFVHFSGHGAASLDRSEDYLIPVDTPISSELALPELAYRLSDLVATIEAAKPAVSFVSIDACRDVVFPRSVSRSAVRGLAKIDGVDGTLIAFATAPGKTAEDGADGQGSTFSRALAVEIAKGGESHVDVFKNVQIAVASATGDRQVPWYTDGIVGRYVFQSNGTAPPPAIANFATQPPGAGDAMPPESAAERQARAVEARESLARMGLTPDADSFANAIKDEDALSVPLFIDAGIKIGPQQFELLYDHLGRMDPELARKMRETGSVRSVEDGSDGWLCDPQGYPNPAFTLSSGGRIAYTTRFDVLKFLRHADSSNKEEATLFLNVCKSPKRTDLLRSTADTVKRQLRPLLNSAGLFSVDRCVSSYTPTSGTAFEAIAKANEIELNTSVVDPVAPQVPTVIQRMNSNEMFQPGMFDAAPISSDARRTLLVKACSELRDKADAGMEIVRQLESVLTRLQ